MDINERFTERAQRAIIIAQQEAAGLGHNYIGTEHLLLGLVKEGKGIAAQVLKGMGVDSSKVIEKIEELIGRGEGSVVGQLIDLTPRSKRVLELSYLEARRMNHNYVGTEHILLGLIREGEGVAAKVLKDLNVDLGKAREEILKNLSGGAVGQGGSVQGNAGTPTLDQYGRDLTQMVREGKFDPVIGRAKEIERVIQILSRRTKNNPVLIGEPGVGKTAIAEGLAQIIVEGQVPEMLKDKRVVTLDLASMVAGAKYRGEFEDRLKKVMSELTAAANVILFIDEMHTIIGAGAAEGAIDASNILKPALSRGEIQAIGATTIDEYRKHVEKDPALERRFQPIMVGEPTVEETVGILKGLRDRYESHHRVKITDKAIDAAATLSYRYIADRFLPDKAIDLIDEAASKVRIKTITAPSELNELEEKIEGLKKEKEEAISHQEFEKAADLRDEERKLKEKLSDIKSSWEKDTRQTTAVVDEENIAEIVAEWTGIPVTRLAEEETQRLNRLEDVLHKRVIGQDEAVGAVAKAVRRARVGLKDPKRPVGSFIFLGPTGVGKTELSRALAEALFGDEDATVRIDMSEYMEKHSVSRLVGSPPGYVGYEEGGQLTEKVRRKPYSVILMDEIEKAHPDVFNILLQILEDGRLTDSKGRVVDFKNTVVIMTSNVGAHTIRKQKSLGFAGVTDDSKKDEYERMKERVMEELKKTFRPEFLNRVDEVIVFHQLDEDHILSIVHLMLEKLIQRVKGMNIDMEVTQDAKRLIVKEGFDPMYGARPLRRAIQNMIEDRLSEEMLGAGIKEGDSVIVDAKDGRITVTRK
ncbi:MAG: ATP-dependent Clp protease ATP-binding subunit [Bacillota bacterium]|nr:ATP-dependent Clp protease ATP-binding subunit [Bacillota bacterium]MDD3297754.1 ATP-dependent Clp protease ATP-binding subunit [Bacillota bacterium]MDD3850089.1 ATP-dependent Clp protease ATP-binding subunit [Bacillota bacterium]MDD4706673.1 ATP-dependent Clp protease ATP-binding subunit [Bacillota bacterium]